MDGATVFIDSGKTSYWVAQEPGYLRGLPLVSDSLEVVPQGLGRADHRVFFAGEAMNVDYRSTFDAVAYVRRFVPDVAPAVDGSDRRLTRLSGLRPGRGGFRAGRARSRA